MEPNPSGHSFWADAAWIALAMSGGIARYLDAYLKSGKSPVFGQIVANALVSGFSGYMVAQFALKVQPDWAFVAAGVGGYLGTQGLDWLADYLRRRVALTAPPTDKKE